MIQILSLLTVLSALLWKRKTYHFELLAVCILTVPVQAYLLHSVVPMGQFTYAAFILVNIALAYLLLKPDEAVVSWQALIPSACWIGGTLVFLLMCYQWPDFMPMGERLRDYALLAGVSRDPFGAEEPWMSGAPLNYYLYWYRTGAVLGALLSLREWDMYHVMAAFTFGLYFSVLVRLFSYFLPSLVALLASLFVVVGSNVEGVSFFFAQDSNWWGPSRVVQGAINEFPAWSFLLGDLHPHFLNYAQMPFFAVLALAVWGTRNSIGEKAVVSLVVFILIGPLWVFNSNAWEVPVLALFVGFTLLLTLLLVHVRGFIAVFASLPGAAKRFWPLLALGLFGCVSLYLSSRNIMPGDTPFRFVRSPIPTTTTGELLRHFGFPLSLILASSFIRIDEWRMRLVFGVGVLVALLSSPALPFIVILGTLQLYRILVYQLAEPVTPARVILEGFGLMGLAMVLIPELVFMDDPYGGENERMNTIFKAYCVAWTALHVYALYLATGACKGMKSLRGVPAIAAALPLGFCIFVFCGFFLFTMNLRKSDIFDEEPVTRGLSQLDRQYPGAAEAIRTLTDAPLGVVLETQGNAYSLTAHVSTLSNKPSYLGWQNHVDLLTRNYGETNRRADVTKQVYSSQTCEDIQALLTREGIRYVVFGPLERQQHATAKSENFKCLAPLIVAGEYEIFRVN